MSKDKDKTEGRPTTVEDYDNEKLAEIAGLAADELKRRRDAEVPDFRGKSDIDLERWMKEESKKYRESKE